MKVPEPMTIGSGYMVLTADDKSNLYYQFEKFSVGDEVLLETSCYDNAALENAQWGTGAGNVIVKNGAMTSSSDWDSALLYKNPRSALGIKADGTVVYYELDGRQSGYSNGISMETAGAGIYRSGLCDGGEFRRRRFFCHRSEAAGQFFCGSAEFPFRRSAAQVRYLCASGVSGGFRWSCGH